MDIIQKLRDSYNNNAVVSQLCDDMAMRERNQSETKLVRMQARLEKKGLLVQKSEVIAAFRTLEECDCGQYVVGRQGVHNLGETPLSHYLLVQLDLCFYCLQSFC